MANIFKRLGELLIESNLVSEQQLLAALAIQENNKKPLGEILVEQGYLTKEKLETILAKQTGSKLGEILISSKIINFNQLQKALDIQRVELRSLGDILVELGYVNNNDLLEALSKQYHLERVNLSQYNINPTAFSKIPISVLKHYNVIPIDIKDGFFVVATSDPENVLAVSDLSFISGMHVKLVLASKKEIQSLLD
jgi:type IV pilus assembly protein PilB